MTLPAAHKEWASLLREKLGGETRIFTHFDDAEETSIDILSNTNEGGTIASTIGLMDLSRATPQGVRTEILIDSRGHDEEICHLLATAALFIIKDGWKIRPGTVFETLVSMYYPRTRLPHLYFTAPFQFDDLSKVKLSDRTIYPLLAIPISEKEAKLAESNFGNDLENAWSSAHIDVLNWKRKSAI